MATIESPLLPSVDRNRGMSFQRITLSLVTVLCLLPYLNFGPLSVLSQVQPWAAIAAWLWVLGRTATLGMKVTMLQWALLVFGLWFMLYVYQGQGFDLSVYFRRSAAFLLSAGIFLAMQYIQPRTLWACLKFALPLWFGFAVLRYVAFSAYFAIVTPLVPTVIESDLRGSSSLAPEATDFGFTMVFLLVLCLITRQRLLRQGLRAEWWPLALAIACAALSKSGIGFFGLTLVLVTVLWSRRSGTLGGSARYITFSVIASALLFLLRSLPLTGIRGLDLLSGAVREPLSLLNGTASYRLVHNAVGLLGLIDSHFRGYGAGAFLIEAPKVYVSHHLGTVFHLTGYYAINVPLTLSQSPVAFFAVLLLEYGAVGLAYIAMVFGFAARSRIPYKTTAVVMLAVAWAQSFPAAWPPFWLLLGLMMNPAFREDAPDYKAEIEAAVDEH